MDKIKVSFRAPSFDKLTNLEIILDEGSITLKDLFSKDVKKIDTSFSEIFTDEKKMAEYLIFVNGNTIQDLDIPLKDGDKILVSTFMTGG